MPDAGVSVSISAISANATCSSSGDRSVQMVHMDVHPGGVAGVHVVEHGDRPAKEPDIFAHCRAGDRIGLGQEVAVLVVDHMDRAGRHAPGHLPRNQPAERVIAVRPA